MFAITLLLVVIVAVAVGYFVIPYFVRAYSRYQGSRIVTCPETQSQALVEIDARHAALTSVVGVPEIRLDHCSRWPINQDCGQECMVHLEGIAPECLVRGVLSQWYRGKTCVYCAKHFNDVHWLDHKPALQSADGELLDWGNVKIEALENALVSSSPVCWDCYIAQSFKREHPDLVVYRPWVEGRSADANRH